jgi:serine/threonine protein kinase
MKIAQKYELLEKIGQGKFGSIYFGKHTKKDYYVAIKIQTDPTSQQLLKHETTILNYLYTKGCRQIPVVSWFGIIEKLYVLIIPHYDMSLDKYVISRINNKLTDVAYLYKSMIQIIQNVHKHYVVHRDLKPQNFMLKGNNLFLIDFGLATFYVDENGSHKDIGLSKEHLIGSLFYVSYHVHNGYEVTRRDDILSLFYILLFILGEGTVPWNYQTFFSNTFEKTHINHPTNIHIKQQKCLNNCLLLMDKYLCVDVVSQPVNQTKLVNYIQYMYELSFMEMPDYDYLCHLFE